jgi:hypothetical protein
VRVALKVILVLLIIGLTAWDISLREALGRQYTEYQELHQEVQKYKQNEPEMLTWACLEGCFAAIEVQFGKGLDYRLDPQYTIMNQCSEECNSFYRG